MTITYELAQRCGVPGAFDEIYAYLLKQMRSAIRLDGSLSADDADYVLRMYSPGWWGTYFDNHGSPSGHYLIGPLNAQRFLVGNEVAKWDEVLHQFCDIQAQIGISDEHLNSRGVREP